MNIAWDRLLTSFMLVDATVLKNWNKSICMSTMSTLSKIFWATHTHTQRKENYYNAGQMLCVACLGKSCCCGWFVFLYNYIFICTLLTVSCTYCTVKPGFHMMLYSDHWKKSRNLRNPSNNQVDLPNLKIIAKKSNSLLLCQPLPQSLKSCLKHCTAKTLS